MIGQAIAAGLRQLAVRSLEDYEALAERLAAGPAMLSALKRRLAESRDTMTPFDTPRYARSLEEAYRTMWRRTQRGEAPTSFTVGEP